MPTDTRDLRKLYDQIEALRAMADSAGYAGLETVLKAALLDLERRLNDPAGPEAFTAPRLRH